MFGSESVLERDGLGARSSNEITHQGNRRRRRADDVDTPVKIEDHVLGLVALDGDLDAGDTSDLNRILLDIGSHRHLCHELAERSPQCRDICAGVELALAQDGIQLELLLFAHQYFSRVESARARHRQAPARRIALSTASGCSRGSLVTPGRMPGSGALGPTGQAPDGHRSGPSPGSSAVSGVHADSSPATPVTRTLISNTEEFAWKRSRRQRRRFFEVGEIAT